MNLELILIIVALIWLVVLTVVYVFLFRFFNRLTKVTNEPDLQKLFEKLLDFQGKNKESLAQLESEVKKIKDSDQYHIQRIGMVRFNPFKEIGGEHSFSVALMDAKNTGIVITGLHTRERTRVYVKSIKLGKCELELSEEEKKAIEKAQK